MSGEYEWYFRLMFRVYAGLAIIGLIAAFGIGYWVAR